MIHSNSKINAKVILATILSVVSCSSIFAYPFVHLNSPEKTTNRDLAQGRLHLNGNLSDSSAYQVGGDFWVKGVRAFAGLGFELGSNDLLKFSGEYLQEKSAYHFIVGNAEKQRMHQTALGVAYQKNVMWHSLTSINVAQGWSSAPGRSLPDFFVERHLAGVEFYATSLGATFSAWEKASAYFELNYDYMTINRALNPTRKVSGLGVGAGLIQKINSDVTVEAKVELRRPFNSYRVGVNYLGLQKGWVVGAFLGHVQSSYNLPSTTSAGISITYTIGADDQTESAKGVTEWVNIPAFTQPEVLVATDELLVSVG